MNEDIKKEYNKNLIASNRELQEKIKFLEKRIEMRDAKIKRLKHGISLFNNIFFSISVILVIIFFCGMVINRFNYNYDGIFNTYYPISLLISIIIFSIPFIIEMSY